MTLANRDGGDSPKLRHNNKTGCHTLGTKPACTSTFEGQSLIWYINLQVADFVRGQNHAKFSMWGQ